MDRLEDWRVFVAVAGRRSFAGAAKALGRSPQAVTRAVAALEGRLGTRLLNRTTRSVSLTADGERLLERGRLAVAEIDRLEAGDDARAPLTGRVSVTSSVLFGQLHVLPIVGEFLGHHAGVDVRLLLLDRVVSLAEEGVDLAVRLGPLPDSALRARLVGQVRSLLVASPAYLARAGVPRAPEALAKHACIAFSATTPVADRWSFAAPGRRPRAVAVRARLVVNTAPAAIEAALAGLGVVRVLSYQVAALVAAKKLQPVLAGYSRQDVPVHLVHLAGTQPRATSAFFELAATRLRARLA